MMPPSLIWQCWGIEPSLYLGMTRRQARITFIAFLVFIGALTAYMLCNIKSDWGEDCKVAREHGAEQLLTYAYSLAAKSVDTVDFANYKVIPQRRAERDSVRSAKKVRKFVKNTNILYIGYNRQGTPVLRTGAVIRDPEFQKLSRNYQVAAQRLIVQRKILSSEHK